MDDKFLSGGGYTGTQWSAHSDPYSIIPFGNSEITKSWDLCSIMTIILKLIELKPLWKLQIILKMFKNKWQKISEQKTHQA